MKRYSFVLLCLALLSCKEKKKTDPVVVPVYHSWSEFSMGVDLSYVNNIQAHGGQYRVNGTQKDPFQILKDKGANTVRVRLWHNPVWVANLNGGIYYHDLYDVEKTIKRAKDLGMAVNLDFHYSDTWADPGHQETPAAWAGLDLAKLKDSVYNYTLAVLNYLKSKNLTPEMVQVGNEVNNGMCWPVGKVNGSNFDNFSELLKSGIKAVRYFSNTSTLKPRIILHDAGLQSARWWLEGISSKGVTDFDIIGLSHYCKWSTINSMQAITDTLKALKASFGKPVMIVETAYPWAAGGNDSYGNIFSASDSAPGYGISKEEQYRYLKDLTLAIYKGGGIGIQYWEPAWISSSMSDSWGTGSAWENCTLFDFSGDIMSSADYMTIDLK